MKNMDNFFAGIDLGTTNSAISILEEDGNRLNTPVVRVDRKNDAKGGGRSRKAEKTLPSAVMYARKEGGKFDTFVGDFARDSARLRPYAVALSVKEQMGKPALEYPEWQEDCPDQTPHQVSARILEHLLYGVENAYGQRPTDAVITVPANYSAMKREATLKAAELAGLNVRKADGSYRDDILLSEPEAVIYHVLNEKQKGELALMCDFAQPKNIMVYDMGGGTLDITLHQVRQAPEDPDVYEMKLVATNRYSDMAGNTMDRMLARYMYDKYMQELHDYDEKLYRQAQTKRNWDMAIFERMAEEVKVRFNERINNFERFGNALPLHAYEEYGGPLSEGREVENAITRGELEECLCPCLGRQYSYGDYKRFEQLPEEKNMLYPVLQVLHRGAKKLGVSDLKVDMVILNGGMSRLYLVREGLKNFFGFPMTMVSDPDTSVAQGASVYHYYRSKKGDAVQNSRFEEAEVHKHPEFRFRKASPNRRIRTMGTVLNEDLYLGTSCGSVVLLAAQGTDLPYRCAQSLEFTLSAGERCIEIPLKERHGHREITVGRGRIGFAHAAPKPVPVNVQVSISASGLLELEADSLLGRGSIEILLGEGDGGNRKQSGSKLNPPKGTKLVPANQMHQLKSLVKEVDDLTRRNKPKQKFPVISRINQCANNMKACGNPEEFAPFILRELSTNSSEAMALNLFPVAAALCPYWSERERKQLSGYALNWLNTVLSGLGDTAFRLPSNLAAVKVIGVCGIKEHLVKLEGLKGNACYTMAVEEAFAFAEELCGG